MTFKDLRVDHQEVTVTADVEGMDAVHLAYSKAIHFIPDHVSIRYVAKDGEWVIQQVTVSGVRLLKSGGTSDSRHSNDYQPWWTGEKTPPWALQFAEDHKPSAGIIVHL